MASNTPPRLTGPSPDAERARRINDPLTERALDQLLDFRTFELAIQPGTDLVVRHDLRQSLIPLVAVVGVGNIVQIVSVGVGSATLRQTAGTATRVRVRFERVTER